MYKLEKVRSKDSNSETEDITESEISNLDSVSDEEQNSKLALKAITGISPTFPKKQSENTVKQFGYYKTKTNNVIKPLRTSLLIDLVHEIKKKQIDPKDFMIPEFRSDIQIS